MIGAIAILLIAFWFYQTAQQRNLPALPWAVGGVLVYYLGFAAWMYLAMRPLMGAAFKSHSLWQGLAMDLSSVAVGALLAALFRARVMLKKGQTSFESPF